MSSYQTLSRKIFLLSSCFIYTINESKFWNIKSRKELDLRISFLLRSRKLFSSRGDRKSLLVLRHDYNPQENLLGIEK